MPAYTVRLCRTVRYHDAVVMEAPTAEVARLLVEALPDEDLEELVDGPLSLYADPVAVLRVEDERGRTVS